MKLNDDLYTFIFSSSCKDVVEKVKFKFPNIKIPAQLLLY